MVNGTSGNLSIVDVSNPYSPSKVSSLSTGTNPASVYVQGRYAYVANEGSNTLGVYDVSNPASPVSVGSVSTGTTPSSVYVQGRYAYVANFTSNNMQIFDLGGEYTQQLQAGGAEVGTLQVDSNESISGNSSIQGGLNVSSGLQVSGGIGVSGSLNLNAGTSLATPTTPTVSTSASTAAICGGHYLTNATTYYYEVAAVNGSSISAVSAGVSQLTGTSTCNLLTWSAVANATGYIVYESSNNQTWFSNTVSSTTLGIVDNGTNYTWTSAASPLTTSNNGGNLIVGGSIQGASTTGTNLAGSNLNIAGGQGTGTGNGGNITFQVAAAGTTGSTQNALATVATFSGTNGSLLLKNSVNSTSAFQVQTAGSSSVLSVDTTNQIVTINQGSTISGWQTNTALPSGVWATGSFTYAGNLYEIKGSTVYEAPIAGNGSTGGWTAASTFSGNDNYMSATVYNGYVYVFSSDTLNNTVGCSGSPAKIYSAPISGGGVIGTWTQVGSGYDGYDGTLQAYNGYLYLSGLFNTLGGCGGVFAATDNTVWAIPITGGGAIGSATGYTWPSNTGGAFTTIRNGYFYTFGGYGGTNTGTVIATSYAASINVGTGAVGSATSATSLPTAIWSLGASAIPTYNGTVYIDGGSTSGTGSPVVNTFYSASLNTTTVGSWASGATLPQSLAGQGNILYGSYLYSIGGYNGSAGISTVYYTSLTGTATLLQIQNNGTNVITASNTGNLLLRPSIDSTSVLQVQNAAGSTEFNIDTQNGRIGIATNSPGNLLSVGALSTAAGTYQIAVTTGGTTNSGIIVQDVASQSSGYAFTLQNSSGSSLASIDYQGNLSVQNATITGTLTVNGHIVTTNASGSTTAAVQTNAGTGSTCTVTGDDTDGTITLVTGTASWASGAQCIISFGSSFTAAPNTVMSPTGSTNVSSVAPTVIPSTGSFTVNFINADTASHTYTWDYVNLH